MSMQVQASRLGAPSQGSERPMNRIESNLEDLNRASDSLARSMARLTAIAISLGYFHPEPPNTPSPTDVRSPNLHEAVKKIERQVEMLSASLNVFD